MKFKNTNIKFIVQDSGIGIAKENRELIFERFQQVDASDARNGEGTGLGLAICRSIIDAHGGRLIVESEVGMGTQVLVYLPQLTSRRAPVALDSGIAKTQLTCNNPSLESC